MRILWVTANGGNYKSQTITGTGGWIGAMQERLCKAQPDMELGITFLHPTDTDDVQVKNVTYLPVQYQYGTNGLHKLCIRHFRNEAVYRSERIKAMVKKIQDYKPDLIHIWGIEQFHASILEYIKDIPVVVHIQGLLSACMYAHTPPAISLDDMRKSDSWMSRIVFKNGNWGLYLTNLERAKNEVRCSRYVKNWIGRTEWDKTMAQMLSPNSRYFHVEELMRDNFEGSKWSYHYDGKTINIMSTISADWYKGIDVVLNTAYILKKHDIDIKWNIFGWERKSKLLKTFIKKLGIIPEDVNVVFHGKVNGEAIRNGLLACDCYVHPSYIENSSNAIAEAQMLGVPVIAQYVGGNPTMLKNDSGMLVAPNEPYTMASAILDMRDESIATGLSSRALAVASLRQNKSKTISDLLDVYKQLIK